ncbi:MAG TPA: hypothetical protein VM582_04525, partial [Candidatus Thermoplasmatota archaeon]|nr:hypothetical protein [Candidatus Thermoplasmatota archaeon]
MASRAALLLDALRWLALRVLLVDAVVLAGVALLGLALRWSTRAQWGEALVWSGLAAVALGGLAVRGAWESRLAHVGFAASTGHAELGERARRA